MSDETRAKGAGTWVALGIVFGIHLALVAHFAPPAILLADSPLLGDGYALSTYHADRALLAAERGGTSLYDPQVLAGRRAGAVHGLGGDGLVYVALVAKAVGLAPHRLFGAALLAGHALVPLLGAAAAALFGLGRRAVLAGAGLWTLLWFFDSLSHFAWQNGEFSWAFASLSGVVAVALGHWARGAPERRCWALGAGLTLIAVLYPLALVIPVVALIVMMIRDREIRSRRVRLWLGAALGLPVGIAVCRVALAPQALAMEAVGPALPATLDQLIFDLVEIPRPGSSAAGLVRTVFRTASLGALLAGAVFGIGRLSRRPELLTFVGVSLAVGYLADYLPLRWPLAPHGAVLGAGFAAALAAGEVSSCLLSQRGRRAASPPARLVGLLAAVVVVPQIGRTALTFFPGARPERVIRSPADVRMSALVALDEPLFGSFALEGVSGADVQMARWLARHGAAQGRVLVDDPSLAATIATATAIPVAGPLVERGLAGGAADWFSRPAARRPAERLDEYLAEYGVALVVTGRSHRELTARSELFHPPEDVGGWRVWRVRAPSSLIAEGEGVVSSARPGALRIEKARGARVVLRVRFDDALVCRPGCRLEPTARGWTAVVAPPSDFELTGEG